MKSRVNVRCAACGWNTSRAPKADGAYGRCRDCGEAVRPTRPRPHAEAGEAAPKPTAPPRPSPFNTWFVQQYGDGHTWPELVAAELDRQERERGEDTAL